MGKKKLVITIGRQYGSGGTEIGRKLAKELDIEFYDKNILRMNSSESGIKESYFHLVDEKAGDKLLYRIISNLAPEIRKPSFGPDLISADNLFRFQSEVIRKLAEAESCVIAGRCADYILEDIPDLKLLRVYIYADFGTRVSRVLDRGLCPPQAVEQTIRRIDKERRDYYRYYTGRSWSDPVNYDLLINASTAGIRGSIDLIKEYLRVLGLR